MKKIFIILSLVMLISLNSAFASEFDNYVTNGQNCLSSSQYSDAIKNFTEALKIRYNDNSVRINLANSYLARGTYYANNEQAYDKASDDFRAALFYLKYYPDDEKEILNAQTTITATLNNLEQCMNALGESKTAQERYNRGRVLRSNRNFAAAGYEFYQAIAIGDSNVSKHSYSNLGDIYSVMGNKQKALKNYQKSVVIDPNNPSLRLKYAQMLDKLNQEDLAVQEYNTILSQGSKSPQVLDALERLYVKKLASNPNSAELNMNIAVILQSEGKLDAALNYYNTAESLDPKNLQVKLNKGSLYQLKKDYNKAFEQYNSILTLYPNNKEANLYRARVLVELNQKEEAVKSYSKVLTLDPTNVEAKRALIELQKDLKTPEELLAALSNDATVDKSSITAMYDYAVELHKAKKYDEAISYYKEVLKHETNNPEYYSNLALAYADKGDYDNALIYINGAKSKFQNNETILNAYNKIKVSQDNKKYNEAVDLISKGEYQKAINLCLTIYPVTKDVAIATATAYKGLNQIDKSIEFYKKAYNLDKNDVELAYSLGVLYAEKENWLSAKIYLQDALKINPKYESASDLLSTVVEQNNINLINKVVDLYNAKAYDSGLKIISQILTEDNKNSYAYYYRGLIYDAQQKKVQAIAEYKKAISYNPELFISDYLIATAYDELGQYANAYSYFSKFVNNPSAKASAENKQYLDYARSRMNDLKGFANK